MKVKDYSYETFPRYTVNIDGALELKGNKENLRCRMKDVEYQKGCMIRFLFPNTILDEERKYPLVIHVQGSGWYKQDMNDHIFDFSGLISSPSLVLSHCFVASNITTASLCFLQKILKSSAYLTMKHSFNVLFRKALYFFDFD